MGAEDWETSSASCRIKDAERAKLKADVDAFLKSGRKPIQCQMGESAEFGKPHNPTNAPDPAVIFQRAAGQAKKAKAQNKAATGRQRLTVNHIEILRASVDLQRRGMKSNLVNISRETGQSFRSAEMRIDVMVVRGMMDQEGRQFFTTEKGRE